MVSWGVWAVFAEFATETLAPEVAMGVSYVAGVSVAVGYIVAQGYTPTLSGAGVGYAVAGGLASGVGSIAYYAALQRGSTALPTTVTGLYFVVAAGIGIALLGEPVDARDLAGIALAVGAVVLLSS